MVLDRLRNNSAYFLEDSSLEKHSSLYKWFWYRPLFRNLRPRLMTMILALVLPLSLVCMVLSAVSIYQSRKATYEMNQNALGFYMDQLALRHELGDIDAVTNFPSALAPRLTLLYWNVGAEDARTYNGGAVYASADEGQTFKILPDGSWEDSQTAFDQLKKEKHFFLWEKEGKPFRVLVAFPYDFSMRNLPVWFWLSLLISVLTIINCPVLFARLKKDILDPIETMNTALATFQDDQSYRIPPHTGAVSDDFLHLFDHFNAMAAEVQESHEKDMKLLETEMDNLRLQVNPHMLLNSYNMIYALAESKNYATIQDYSLCLADYFRYVLRKGQQMVTVKQELEFVENFIRIQRIRFPDRFSYVYQAEEDCMAALIPPLLIENFVENAIKYALNPKEPIEIVVSVHREEKEAGKDDLHIAIMDTGSGIRPEVLEKLQKKEPYIDEAGQKHIGIYNCLRRVELFYGDEGDIHFSSAVGGGTQVYLIIPFSLTADYGTRKEARA